jgi:hypothetical protein
MSRVIALLLSAAFAVTLALPAQADELMARFSGEWVGTGQLLFGPQYGTEFQCELKGDPNESRLNFNMSGRCWIGILSAPVYARLRYNADTKEYYGEFLDGAEGSGVNMVGTQAGHGISLKLVRGRLQGRLTAETVTADQMKVMMFYRDIEHNRELPVVAMGFARKGTDGLPDYLPSFVTGSTTPRN